jgi:hypothetical protein
MSDHEVPVGSNEPGDAAPPDLPLEVLEADETVPPRPEEELADVERSERQP